MKQNQPATEIRSEIEDAPADERIAEVETIAGGREAENIRQASDEYELETPEESLADTEETRLRTVNVLDLFMIILKYRMLIFCFVAFSALLGFRSALDSKNIYRAEAVIVAKKANRSFSSYSTLGSLSGIMAGRFGMAAGNLNKINTVLASRDLTHRIIKKYNLLPVLFPKPTSKKGEKKSSSPLKWFKSEDKKKVVKYKPPTIQDGYGVMKASLSVALDIKSQSITVGYTHTNPGMARTMVILYIRELSEKLREEVLHDSIENIRFFRDQINETRDPILRDKLYSFLAKEIETNTFAKAQKYYSFQVIDPPVVPDNDKRVAPNRKKTLMMSVFVSFGFAVAIAFLTEFVLRMRKKYPERYGEIIEGLRPRIRKRR